MPNEKLSSSLEDYLEAIWVICQDKQMAHANHIAETLGVSKSSVSWALNRLAEKKLINYVPYEAITLTAQGETAARKIARRHDEIKNFLTTVLAIDEKTAQTNACRMEHVVDKQVLQRMTQFMDFLKQSPCPDNLSMDTFAQFCHKNHKDTSHPDLQTDENTSKADDLLPKTPKERDKIILRRLTELLEAAGQPLTQDEQTIADIFMAHEKHFSLENLSEQVRKTNPSITTDAVEKTMQILCEHKIARTLTFNNQTVFEHFHPESHHDHLFCVKCGAIVEFFDPRIEALQMENARESEFRLLQHHLNLYGVCRNCLKREANVRPLKNCLRGELLEIVRIVADRKTQNQIADMGLPCGTIVELLNDLPSDGNIIVMAAGTRLMLDNATAAKIKVVPLKPDQVHKALHRHRRRHRHAADNGNIT